MTRDMRAGRRFVAAIAGVALALVAGHGGDPARPVGFQPTQAAAAQPPVPAGAQALRPDAGFGQLPLAFEENRGQFDERVRYCARSSGTALFLTDGQAVLSLSRGAGAERSTAALTMRPVGGDADARPVAEQRLRHRTNYLIGADPSRWHRGVESYERVRYPEVYPGIDLVYYGNDQRRLEYDFVVQPGADPTSIRLALEGADELSIDSEGNLVVELPGGEVTQQAPVCYQTEGGERTPVEGRYLLRDDQTLAFALGPYDRTRALVIDPVLLYSTYFGGSGGNSIVGVAVDASGAPYIAGATPTADLPGPTSGSSSTVGPAGGLSDVYVAKLEPDGSAVLFLTYLGGSGTNSYDSATGIAVDRAGRPVVVGKTTSSDFPTNATALGTAVSRMSFVTELSADGTSLVYSALVYGAELHAVCVGANDEIYAAGEAFYGFPVTSGSFQETAGGSSDGGVLKIDPRASVSPLLQYATRLGGKTPTVWGGGGTDCAYGLAVDAAGSVAVTGITNSDDFPLANAYQGVRPNPGQTNRPDAFVTRLNAQGDALVFSTYLGASAARTYGQAVAFDGAGQVYVACYTSATSLPTTVNAYQTTGSTSYWHGFVAGFGQSGSRVYATYLDGSGSDFPAALAVSPDGAIYVAGGTDSDDFPTSTDAIQPNRNTDGDVGTSTRKRDAFLSVLRIAATGTDLVYSTYLGGKDDDNAFALALAPGGRVLMAGQVYGTAPLGFPVTNALQPTSASSNSYSLSSGFLAAFGPSNHPPTANAGVDVSQTCTGLTCTVSLDGTASTDPDSTAGTQNDIVSYEWFENGTLLTTGESASVTLPLGTHTITLVVTDAAGETGSDTLTITLDPAALSLVSIEKAKVDWNKAKLKLHGKIAAPAGVLPALMSPEATVHLKLGEFQALATQAVQLQVKGDEGSKWEVKDAGDIRKLKIDWRGARFKYETSEIEIEAEHIGQDRTTLEIETNGKKNFTVAVNGLSVHVDAAGAVSVTPPAPFDVDHEDDGELEIELDLPFALDPSMTIEVTGSIIATIAVADHYTEPVGKFELQTSIAGLLASFVDGNTRPATLHLDVTLGAEQFPGSADVFETDWQKLTVETWKFKRD